MSDHPRQSLYRLSETPKALMRLREDDHMDGRTLVGYPIVFDEWTPIDSWEGRFIERIHPKALDRTLARRGDNIKVLWNHGFDPSIGEKPLGKPAKMEVDERGLYVEVPFARTSYNDDLLELIRAGAVDGMSFRFTVQQEQWVEKPGRSDHNPEGWPERTIHQADVHEFGPVTFPAYLATTAGVRAAPAYQMWRQANGDNTDTVNSTGWTLNGTWPESSTGSYVSDTVSRDTGEASSEEPPGGQPAEAPADIDGQPAEAPVSEQPATERERLRRRADLYDRRVELILRKQTRRVL